MVFEAKLMDTAVVTVCAIFWAMGLISTVLTFHALRYLAIAVVIITVLSVLASLSFYWWSGKHTKPFPTRILVSGLIETFIATAVIAVLFACTGTPW